MDWLVKLVDQATLADVLFYAVPFGVALAVIMGLYGLGEAWDWWRARRRSE